MKFNENLKYLRKREGLTQEELAEKLNVSRQSVTKWESGMALPDIEKVKEIAYLFSVSVDALIGEIESKSENRIKRKVNDIGYFIFAYIVLALMLITSISQTISYIFNDENITIIGTIGFVIFSFVLFIFFIKKYLTNYKDVILNMKETEDGKKERKKYLFKKYLYIFISGVVYGLLIELGTILNGITTILETLISSVVCVGIIVSILMILEYKKLEKEVKELNKQ